MSDGKVISEKTDFIKLALAERKEYEEFEHWCTEHNPDAWMNFQDWRSAKYAVAIENSTPAWAGE